MPIKTLSSMPENTNVPTPDSAIRQVGFAAQLQRVTLPDLVQMECLSGSEASFRVVSDANTGYLMFSGGQLVHAMTRTLRGEAAAQEILSWQQGKVDPCKFRAPNPPTILSHWQELLMRAAQQSDENPTPNVGLEKVNVAQELNDSEFLSSDEPEKAVGSGRALSKVIRAVRLDTQGNVVVARGEGNQEDFAELSAYAVRMAQVVGEGLGMGGFRALEWTLPSRNGLLYVESNGSVASLEASPQAELNTLRRRIGL